MNRVCKITLLITMAVVIWKVLEIEKHTKKSNYYLSVSSKELPELSANTIASIY